MNAASLTPERQALSVARQLVDAGIPVFAAPPVLGRDGQWDPMAGCCGYRLPAGWQKTEADGGWLDPTASGFADKAWRPGWALAAVMGHGLDLLDIDPRNGGDPSRGQLVAGGAWPRVYAEARTPSGGTHDFVASLHVGSRDGVLPGFDVKGGLPDGSSRGFAFIPPTLKLCKVTGQLVPYCWTGVSALDSLGRERDESGRHIGELVRQLRRQQNARTTSAKQLTAAPTDVCVQEPSAIAEGQRHKQLLSYAGRMRQRGLSLAEAVLLMRRRWEGCAQPPTANHELPWEEAEALLQDVFTRYEADDRLDGQEEGAQDAYERRVAAEVCNLRARGEAARIVRQERAGATEQPTLVRLTDFLAVEDEPGRYRVERVWPAGGRIVLAAQYKAGKTTLRNNLLRSLVDGDPFLKEFRVESFEGSVVLIDNELDERMLRRWLREQGIKNTDRVQVLCLRGKVGSFDLLNDHVRARFATMIRDVRGAVVLFDCLRPVLDALGLSEDKDAGRFLVAFDALLAESGASEAVVIHHMGHSGERSRGDTRIRDWPDAEWQLIREVTDSQHTAEARRFFKAYGRDVHVPEGLLEYDEETRRVTLAGGGRRQTAAEGLITNVLDYLEAHPRASQRSIEVGLKPHKRADVRAAIKEGTRQKLIQTEQGLRNSTLHWVADSELQMSAPTAPEVRRRTTDECASAPIEGALSTVEVERLLSGALDWLPTRMPSRQAVGAAA